MSKKSSHSKNPFDAYHTISKIMDARSNHLARIEEIENDFNERLDPLTQKLFELFEKAQQLKKKHATDREHMIKFNDILDEKIEKIIHVVPELANSSQSSSGNSQSHNHNA